jgi:hypothetical protein
VKLRPVNVTIYPKNGILSTLVKYINFFRKCLIIIENDLWELLIYIARKNQGRGTGQAKNRIQGKDVILNKQSFIYYMLALVE